MELLLLASRNPNVPDAQRQEAKNLSEQLKDSLELSLKMKNSENDSFEKVLAQVSDESQKYESWEFSEKLNLEKARFGEKTLKQEFMDCADNVFCAEAENVLN